MDLLKNKRLLKLQNSINIILY